MLPPFEARPKYPIHLAALPLAAGLLDVAQCAAVLATRFFHRDRFSPRCNTERRRRRGLTFVLGGVEGPSRYSYNIVRALLAGGYRGAVINYPWNAGPPVINCLVNHLSRRHHQRHAQRLAMAMDAYLQVHPRAPLHLIAQSGGCWIVTRALEMLPANRHISSAVLLAPAFSPDYDLSAAASHCSGKLITIGGPGDAIVLGLATILWGTSDRRHVSAAGWVGCRTPVDGVIDCRWRPEWLRHGYLGNHISSSAFRFVRDVIAPLLRVA